MIFAAGAMFLDFSFDFGFMSNEKLMFFLTRFPHAARLFFRNGDPYDSVVFAYRKLLFHFSRWLVFRKKCEKNIRKPRSENNLEKRWSGHPFWHRKPLKIGIGNTKIGEINGKSRFSDRSFFVVFFNTEELGKIGKKS